MLVSLNDMKTYLGIPLVDVTHDLFLTMQLQVVTEAVEGYCNRKFSQATYTQTFYRKDFVVSPDSLSLFHYPLVSVASILEKELSSDPGLAVSGYGFHIPSGRVFMPSGRFFSNGNLIEVQYDAGYASVPMIILNVVYSLVQERFNKKVNGIDLNFGSDVQRISIAGTISVDFDYSLNNNERKNAYGHILGSHLNILDSYRSERSVMGDVRLSHVQ
jgi:hypothetical protein